MQIHILFFGILRDITNNSTLKVDVEGGSTLGDLKQLLVQKCPKLSEFKNYTMAVNEAYAEADYIIKESDVVALIPPVSGG